MIVINTDRKTKKTAINEVDTIDRRYKTIFHTLNERQEIELVSDLIDFLIYYKNNKNDINKEILKTNEKIDEYSIGNYWINNIAKTKRVDSYVKMIDVIVDMYPYIKLVKENIAFLPKTTLKTVCLKTMRRTEDQLHFIENAFANYPEIEEISEIFNFLRTHNLSIYTLSYEHAERIIHVITEALKKIRY
ncbi:hypothetical protein [Petrocella sp. FN5]|uniref:hypothetical protein n=1 Tax=Petrocella sp. FN5 TaxID=3032002 RepID=UPI0023DC9ED7|nr:hypothetical protein [Petrocella sp. FN5]MDF1617296.1 hypothetical protein [Petrocella sp. FN5]